MPNIFLCLDFEENLKLWLVSHNPIVHRRDSHLDYTHLHSHLRVWWGRRMVLQHVHSIPHWPDAQNKRALIQFHSTECFCAYVFKHGLEHMPDLSMKSTWIFVPEAPAGIHVDSISGWGGHNKESNIKLRLPTSSDPNPAWQHYKKTKQIHSQTRSEVTRGQHCQAVFVIVILPCLQLHLFRAAVCCMGD